MIREWLRRVTRLGAHSKRSASSFDAWAILLSSPDGETGYIPKPAGQHRPEKVRRVWFGHRLSGETVLSLFPPSRVDWAVL